MSGEIRPRRSTGTKVIRFAIVGVVNTLIDLAVFAATVPHVAWPVTANVLAWSVAATFSFVANSFWSFERSGRIGILRSLLRFASLGALVSLGVSSLSVGLLATTLGVWPAKLIGVAVAATLNFVASRWSIEGNASG